MKPSRAFVVCCSVLLPVLLIVGALSVGNSSAGNPGGIFAETASGFRFGSYIKGLFEHTLRADFKGTVTNSAGNPIVGATVQLVFPPRLIDGSTPLDQPLFADMPVPDGKTDPAFPTTTDAKGYYELHVFGLLAETEAEITCEAAGFVKQRKDGLHLGATPPPPARQDFQLEPGVKLSGTVTNVSTGAAVNGAVLRFGKWHGVRDSYEHSANRAVTGAGGGYEIYLKPDCYGFYIAVDDMSLCATPRQLAPIKVTDGKPATMNIALQPTVALHGIVQATNGSPLSAGSRLEISTITSHDRLMEVFIIDAIRAHCKLQFNGDGSFQYELPGFIPGDLVEVEFLIVGFSPISTGQLTITSTGARQAFDLKVSRGSTLRGRLVLPDGSPAANRTVELRYPSRGTAQDATRFRFRAGNRTTDSGGNFVFENLGPGLYSLSEASRIGGINLGDEPASPGASIELDGMHDVTDFELKLRSAHAPTPNAITGTVLDSSGKPVQDAIVTAIAGFDDAEYSARADVNGRFTIDLARPGIVDREFEVSVKSAAGDGTAPSVTIGTDLELNLASPYGFEGAVLDATATPLPGCPVSLVEIDDSNGSRAATGREARVVSTGITDASGTFRFKRQAFTGNHFVVARDPRNGSGISSEFHLTTQRAKGIEIHVVRGHAVRGHVLNTAGQPLDTAHVRLFQSVIQAPAESGDEFLNLRSHDSDPDYETLSAADGSFAFEDVMPGEYRALVERSGFASLSTPAISVAVGQDPGEQTMVLGKGGCISCNLDLPLPANVSTSIHVEPRNRSLGIEPDPGAMQLHACDMPADRYIAYVTYTGPSDSVTSIIQKFDLKMDEQRELDAAPKPGSTTVSVKVSDFSGGEKVEVMPVDDNGEVIWGGEGNVTTGSGPLGADGTFTAYCIAPGNYLVTVDSPDDSGEGCQSLIPLNGKLMHLTERRITVKPNEPMTVECSVAPSPDRLP